MHSNYKVLLNMFKDRIIFHNLIKFIISVHFIIFFTTSFQVLEPLINNKFKVKIRA
jgi:hypothetical protein